jgi:hypothetical protein
MSFVTDVLSALEEKDKEDERVKEERMNLLNSDADQEKAAIEKRVTEQSEQNTTTPAQDPEVPPETEGDAVGNPAAAPEGPADFVEPDTQKLWFMKDAEKEDGQKGREKFLERINEDRKSRGRPAV